MNDQDIAYLIWKSWPFSTSLLFFYVMPWLALLGLIVVATFGVMRKRSFSLVAFSGLGIITAASTLVALFALPDAPFFLVVPWPWILALLASLAAIVEAVMRRSCTSTKLLSGIALLSSLNFYLFLVLLAEAGGA